jgi:hypothetical protein
LANGKRYTATFNNKTGAFAGYMNAATKKIYPSSVSYKNFVFVPNYELAMKDSKSHGASSAYVADRLIFSNQSANSDGNFVMLKAGDVDDAANQIKNYCDENACVITNLINDFHGGGGFYIGETWLGNDNIASAREALQKIGAHMNSDTKVLFGNCNAGRLAQPALAVVHMYFNKATIYAHQSYCMSTTLLSGCYADKKATASVYGGDVEAQKYVDVWLKIVAGKSENVKGVRFKVWQDFEETPWHKSSTGNIGDVYEK